jgi:predicted ATPase
VLNLAARLQETAPRNEIVLAHSTWQLVRHAIGAEPLGELALKGRSQATPAFRLVALVDTTHALARRYTSPLIGRDDELGQLRRAIADALGRRTSSLVTLVGSAGVGKSRLATEFLLELDPGIRVLIGRCLPYGEQITFSPIRQMLVEAVGEPLEERVRHAIASRADAGWVSTSVAGLVGLGDAGSLEQGFVALRRLLTHLARDRPLVLIFDDVHWAEPTMLDLIEYLAKHATDAAIFTLCLARPELFEQRAAWGGRAPNASTILLGPLSAPDSRQLAVWLDAGKPISDASHARALQVAEGNPFFLEQLLAFAADERASQGDPKLPPTIEALLGARLDLLEPTERLMVDHAAVVGAEFDHEALARLLPPALEPTLPSHLSALARKQVIRPSRPEAENGPYKFSHVLMRDAAYRSIARRERAEIHARCADWMSGLRHASAETVGYHLEQAYRYRVELGAIGQETDVLARRASEYLERAATAARASSDLRTAISLYERAAAPPPVSDRRRARLGADLAATLMDAGRLPDAEHVLAAARSAAQASSDVAVEARARIEQQLLKLHRAEAGALAEAPRVVASAVAVFERTGDQRALCRAWQVQATASWLEARAARAADAWEHAAAHARAAGDGRECAVILCWVATSAWLGPQPVAAAIHRCEEIREQVSGYLASEADALRPLGVLNAMAGHIEAARELFGAANAVYDDLGLELNAAISHPEAVAEMITGNFDIAERRLRASEQAFGAMGATALRATTAALLARAVFAQGRHEEAERFTVLSEQLADDHDVLTQIIWRGVRGLVLAARERFDEAERLAREAVSLAEGTDFVNFHADALAELATILSAAGDIPAARAAGVEARRLYESKGNVAAATQRSWTHVGDAGTIESNASSKVSSSD